MNRTLLAIAFLALGGAACHDGVAPSDSRIAKLELLPRFLDLEANGGQASVFIGEFRADGSYLEHAPGVMLFVRDTTIAIGEAPTLVTGRRVGSTFLIAKSLYSARVRDSILVRVGHFQGGP